MASKQERKRTVRRAWQKPQLSRLTAGAAEDDDGPGVDAIFNPS